jgi:hypothetical protein
MRARFEIGLVLLSAAVLTLEILDTKIFAYALDAVTLYIAIGVYLLGLGASATLRSLRPALTEAQVRPTAAA